MLKCRLIDAYGEPNAALTAWKALKDAFPSSAADDAITGRITQLEIDLGIAATPPADNKKAGAKEGSGK